LFGDGKVAECDQTFEPAESVIHHELLTQQCGNDPVVEQHRSRENVVAAVAKSDCGKDGGRINRLRVDALP
jgi:hypothetical protein